MSIVTRTPWTRQPQVPVGINWANPLTRGIAVAAFGKQFVGTGLSGPMVIDAGSPSFSVGQQGIGPTFSGGAQRITAGKIGSVSSTEGFSIAILHNFTANTFLAGVFGLLEAGVGARYLIDYGGINLWTLSGENTSSQVYLADGKVHSVVVTNPSGGGATTKFYRDASLIASNTCPTTPTLTNPTVYFGDASQGWSSCQTGSIFLGVYWRRDLSANEVASFNANPWQIFAPLQRRIWVGAAAGGGGSFLPAWVRQRSSIIGAGKGY